MSQALSRVVESDPVSEVVAMTMMIYSIPRLEEKCDALCVFPGMNEHWRVAQAVKLWEKGAGRYLLIANGIESREKYVDLTVPSLKNPPYGLTREREVIVSLLNPWYANDQANWTMEQIKKFNVSSIALFVSPYHLLRAYLTLLKSMFKSGELFIPLIPVPVAVSPDTKIPESEINAWDSVPGELARLPRYQAKGDVATFQELKYYLSWLWTKLQINFLQ